jgi:hypothetical protein
MKLVIALFFSMLFILPAHGQKETYDLLTFTAPAKWIKEISNNNITYTISDKKNDTWCRINIIKSTISKGDIEADFESEWQEIIVKSYKPTDKPTASEVQETDGRLNDTVGQGWKIKAGNAKFIFSSKDAMVMLLTASGYGRCVSIVTVTNSQNYLTDIEALLTSVSLIKPDINSSTVSTNNNNNSVVGTWTKVSNDQDDTHVKNGVAGYIQRQYTFKSDGTYIHYIKTFSFFTDILFTKETGTYQVNGNNISITPQKTIIESWSKKEGRDEWGKLLSAQKSNMEKVAYQFTIDFNATIKRTNLVLKASNITNRDGHFDRDNQWFYSLPIKEWDYIKLPPGQQVTTVDVTNNQVQQTTINNNSPIIGAWGKSNTVGQINNRFGNYSYNKQQYTFNANGTYYFNAKNYGEQYNETILIKESGTYLIDGNKLTITPKRSVIEAWSKKNGSDNWNQLKSSQARKLETATYQFSIADKNLQLQIAAATERDGFFNSENTYSYGPPGTFTAIKLPGE